MAGAYGCARVRHEQYAPVFAHPMFIEPLLEAAQEKVGGDHADDLVAFHDAFEYR